MPWWCVKCKTTSNDNINALGARLRFSVFVERKLVYGCKKWSEYGNKNDFWIMWHEKHDLPSVQYGVSLLWWWWWWGGGVLDHQLKRSLTAGFSVSRGSVQNGHRDVHSLDRCGICTDVQYLHREREWGSQYMYSVFASNTGRLIGAKARPRNNASSF